MIFRSPICLILLFISWLWNREKVMAFTGSLKLPRPVAKTCGHCSVLILTRQLLLTRLSLPPSSNTSFTSLPNTTLSSQPLLLVPLLSSSLPTAPGRRALGSHSYSLPDLPTSCLYCHLHGSVSKCVSSPHLYPWMRLPHGPHMQVNTATT